MEAEKLERSQRFEYVMKKRDMSVRYQALRKMGLRIPDTVTDLPKPAPEGYLYGTAALAVNHVSSKKYFESLARLIPWRAMGFLYSRCIARLNEGF